MSSDEVAIRVSGVSKHYLMFEKPEDRLKQMIVPRLSRLIGRPPRQYFRDFTAVNNVSFEVKRGETVGIIGRNGSGKSTMLQMVVGTLTPSSGTIAVHGRIAALLELGAGFNPEFTGRENVYLNAAILGLTRAETDQRFDAIAAFADIGIFIDQPVKTYSSGMYVRLAFAVAINVDPDILVVDEALSVGDEAFQRKCFARIEDIRDKGGTILFVSHGAQTIVQLCDRAMLFDRGEMILEGRPKTVVSQYQRLANASVENTPSIRASITDLNRAGISATSGAAEISEPSVSVATGTVQTAVASSKPMDLPPGGEPAPTSSVTGDADADYYDPSLVSQSTLALEERGARIHGVRVATVHGDAVNVLQMGKRYLFEYEVDFTANARDVGFGMWIRTIEGIGLGGVQTINSRSQRTPQVHSGESFHPIIEFECAMLPGTYFFTCGIFGTVNSEQVVMHRLIDAIAVRVAVEVDTIAIGRVDLAARVTVSPS